MNQFITIIFILILLSIDCFSCKDEEENQRPRVYILTDISSLKGNVGEPDDTESLVRFLFYANEFQIEGFGATYTSHGGTTYPQYIKKILTAYGKSLDKLRKHENYPSAQALINKVKSGNTKPGTDQIGEGKGTELSSDIISVLKENSKQPLWILIWGGAVDLGQALWKIRSTMPSQEVAKLISKIRVYAIGDQYGECGKWIKSNFKDLFYIQNNGSFRGMYRTEDTSLVSKQWVETNILSIQSPLAQAYPMYDGGDPWGKVTGIKEGDTPSFLYLLPQSPGNPENPETASWGGTFKRIDNTNHFVDCPPNKALACAENVAKWRADFQASFSKRLSWLK